MQSGGEGSFACGREIDSNEGRVRGIEEDRKVRCDCGRSGQSGFNVESVQKQASLELQLPRRENRTYLAKYLISTEQIVGPRKHEETHEKLNIVITRDEV